MEIVIIKTHPRSYGGLCMVCPATTPHEGSAELVPLAPKKQTKKPQEQCPVTINCARVVREPVWLTSWHMSFRGGRRVVTLGRGHTHRDGHALLPEERGKHHIPSLYTCITQHLPLTPGQHLCLKCPPEKMTKERTDKGNVPEGNKTCDQIKFCVPSLLKEKWIIKIQ